MDHKITPRKYEVLACYVETGLLKEVASQLGLSHQTVKNYMRELYREFGVNSSVELYRELGWLSVPKQS